ncbi:MAG: autotransporter-associated beta strand repeat-containing protein [Bacteroidetes bacterium]|nr:autotransporter-associated beta strand repeat-containing protein [Bacteroidota bacterium]
MVRAVLTMFSILFAVVSLQLGRKHLSFSFGAHSVINAKCSSSKLMLVGLLFLCSTVAGQTTTFSGTGNWSSAARWSAGVPTAGSAVYITQGSSCTVDIADAVCASLTFSTITNSNSLLTISGTNSLTVSGLISMPRPSNGETCTIAVGAGTLSCGSLTMSATTTTRNDIITISTGTLNISGTITTGTTGCQLTFTGAGTMNIGGSFTSTPTLTTFTGSTVNYYAAGAQTVRATSYSNLTLSGSGVKTTTGVTVNGKLLMQGTATASAVPTFGAGATLEYNGSALQTTGNEFRTPFVGTGGVIINNSNGVKLGATKTVNYGLYMTSGNLDLNNISLIVGSLQGTTNITSSVAGAITLTIGSDNSSTTYSGSIQNGSGTVAVTKTGTGTLTLTGANTFTGAVTINAGVLSVGTIGNGGVAGNIGAASTAAANLVLGGGTLRYTGVTASTNRNFTLTAGTTSSFEIANVSTNLTISGASASTTGSLTKIGNGTLTLSGTNAHTGITRINAGVLSVGTIGNGGVAGNLSAATNAAANIVLGGGTLKYTGLSSSTNRGFTLTAATTSAIEVSTLATTLTFTGSYVSTTGSLVKSGTGTLGIGTSALAITDLSISAGALTSTSGVLSVAGNFTNSGSFSHNSGTVSFNGGSAQNVAGVAYNNLTITGGNVKTLQGAVSVNSALTLTSGIVDLANFDLTMAAAATTSGASSASFLRCSGTGKLIKNGTVAANFIMTYPVGTGTFYTPFQISSLAAITGGTYLSVKAVASEHPNAPGVDALQKYWTVTSNITGISATIVATADASEFEGLSSVYSLRLWNGSSWYDPSAAPPSSKGIPLTIVGSSALSGDWSAYSQSAQLYSYQSGNWNSATTWTTDPSGTTQVGAKVPADGDQITILNGRTVTLTANVATLGHAISIDAGGTINMGTFRFTNTLTYLGGTGLFRLSTANFPTVTTNDFVTASGGTVEYYNANITLPAQLTYNHLKISNSTASNYTFILQNPTNPTSYTIYGNLTVERTSTGTVTYTMGNAARVINLSINGNVTVGAGCTWRTGAFSAIHNITLYGNLTNSGTIRLTNQASPVQNSYYTAAVTTGGAAKLTFSGNSNATLTCNGITDLYYLVVNKGSDQTYSLTVNSSSTSNFALYGPNNSASNAAKALYIQNGTLKLNSNINIPSLTEGGIDFNILETAALWINGATVSGTVVGLNGTGYQGITVYGKLRVSAGSITSGDAAGLVYWSTAAPEILIEGGTLDVSQVWYASGTGIFTYTQTGGTMNIRHQGENHAGPMLSIPSSNSVFNMSGGTLNFTNGVFTAGQGIDIRCGEGNYNITGGTVNINLPGGVNFGINSTIPFYNLAISRQSGTGNITTTLLNTSSSTLRILNDLTINDNALLNAGTNSVDLFLEHDFSISTNGTYTPGSTTTKFSGSTDQFFTNNGTITTALNNFTIDKTTGTLTLAGSAATFTVNGALSILSGILNDGGKTISCKGSVTNSATHSGTGKISLTGTVTQAISGSGSGVFQNLELNNTNAAAAPVSLSANQTVNGVLTFTSAKLFNIGIYSLTLGSSATISGAGATKFIISAGNASDGGVQKTFSSTSFNFPVGTGNDYTPASISLSGAPSVYGSVCVRPVVTEHPNVTTSGRSLTYYWKTTSSGFTLGSAIVTQTYTYVASDVVTGGDVSEAEYVPGRYDGATLNWASTTSADINTGTKTITFQGATFNTQIDGEYTAGDNNPVSPFGSVLIYYSRNIGGGQFNWSSASSWSTDDYDGAAASSPPASNSPVLIGDDTHYHTITVDGNTKSCGSMEIDAGSVLNLAATTGHSFGTITGSGKLRLSSGSLPAGDLGSFVAADGGTVEYYRNTSDFTLPSGQSTYNNLHITTTGGSTGTITLPAANLTINNNFNIGASDDAASLTVNADATGGRTIEVHGDLVITGVGGSNTTLFSLVSGNNQNIIVEGNVSVSQNATFSVPGSGAAQTHSMTIGSDVVSTGNLVNNGTFDMYSNAGGLRVCNVTFTGTSDALVTGTGATTDFNSLNVNKGSSQTAILNVNASNFTLSGSLPALVLTNGTFRLTSSQALSLATTSSFSVPSTACLSVNGGTINIGTNNDAGDLMLTGKLEVLAGTVSIGSSANNNNNDIEYSGSGSPEIDVQGGNLYVNGQIRRNTTNTLGSLLFSQSGDGNVTIGNRNMQVTRAAFEVTYTGSVFNMSGTGTLTVERVGGTTFGDIYITPESYSVSGGTIQIGSTNTPAGQTFIFYSTAPVWNLLVDATSQTKILRLTTGGLSITNNLTISGNSVFDANSLDVNIGGSLINNNSNNSTGVSVGGYRAGSISQITTFDGSGVSQSITGAGTNLTNFGKLIINNTYPGGSVTMQTNSNIRVNGDLSLTSGTLADGGNAITVVGNVSNSSIHSSTGSGKIALAGSSQQTISGNGSGVFGNLTIDNSSNVVMSDNCTVNGVFTFANGIFIIGDKTLSLGASATLAGSFSLSKMIQLNGAISDGGVRKYFNGSLSDYSFKYPIGVSGKYTPVSYTITTGTVGGYSTVKPVNLKHPNATGPGIDYLNYYWNTVHAITNLTSLTHTYTYTEGDVTGTESNLRDARFFGSSWTVGIPAGNPNTSTNQISFTNTEASGDYTAGIATAFADPGTYTSNVASGNWETAGSWTPSGPPPTGSVIVIQNDHTITVTANSKIASSMTINGNGVLNLASTSEHNFGAVSGTGSILITPSLSDYFVFPGGDYSSFVGASGGTVEFSNASDATLPSQSTFNNIILSGSGSKNISNVNITINGDISFSSGTLDNSAFDKNITIFGNWISNSATPFSPGTGYVVFNGNSILSGSTTTNFMNISVTGTLNDGGKQITGDASGVFSVGSSGVLILGSASSATQFPINYIAGNISLSSGSTVRYNSNIPQTISSIAHYDNLELAATSSVTLNPQKSYQQTPVKHCV